MPRDQLRRELISMREGVQSDITRSWRLRSPHLRERRQLTISFPIKSIVISANVRLGSQSAYIAAHKYHGTNQALSRIEGLAAVPSNCRATRHQQCGANGQKG